MPQHRQWLAFYKGTKNKQEPKKHSFKPGKKQFYKVDEKSTNWGNDRGGAKPWWAPWWHWNQSSRFWVDRRESRKQTVQKTGTERLIGRSPVGCRSTCYEGVWLAFPPPSSSSSCSPFLRAEVTAKWVSRVGHFGLWKVDFIWAQIESSPSLCRISR